MNMKKGNIQEIKGLLGDVKGIIDAGRLAAYSSVNSAMIETYWLIGKRIVEEEQHGQDRAQYGQELIKTLAQELIREYGNGFSERYLRAFRQFYQVMPNYEIWKSRFPNLTWTHVFRTLRVRDENAIRWYLENASQQTWSVRTLSRNIATQYYERHICTCSETDEDIARYSILKGNEQLFAAKYKLYLPTDEELRREIERQKEIYYLQHKQEQ